MINLGKSEQGRKRRAMPLALATTVAALSLGIGPAGASPPPPDDRGWPMAVVTVEPPTNVALHSYSPSNGSTSRYDERQLTWDGVANASGYNIYRRIDRHVVYDDDGVDRGYVDGPGDRQFTYIATVGGRYNTSYKVPVAEGYERHTFYVVAFRAGLAEDQYSTPSETVHRATAVDRSFPIPRNVRSQPSRNPSGRDLVWSPVSGAAGYNLYRLIDGTFTYQHSVSGPSYRNAGAGKYYVTAFDKSGTHISLPSNQAWVHSSPPMGPGRDLDR